MFAADADVGRDQFGPAAVICALLANIHRDPDKRSEPFTALDFLPGAPTQEDDMRAFAEAVMRGDKFEVDPDAVAAFRLSMVTTFKNVRAGEVTNVGPTGKPEMFKPC
jgi:hypothetical protein